MCERTHVFTTAHSIIRLVCSYNAFYRDIINTQNARVSLLYVMFYTAVLSECYRENIMFERSQLGRFYKKKKIII